ncbi:MAG TPA: chemotaxis protein CheD, partial [Thermoanaerobaculia bacterium]|nr:chemotaxis protein CheD [Thermoanaerobaculia bacterium]
HPGQLHVTSDPVLVRTILGSCVAVCLFDPSAGVGGISHFLLPGKPPKSSDELRYGVTSTERLIDQMIGRGCATDRMRGQMFGGACVLAAFAGARVPLGEANEKSAREVLTQRGIHILAGQTGGNHGRTLLFDPRTGAVQVKEIG